MTARRHIAMRGGHSHYLCGGQTCNAIGDHQTENSKITFDKKIWMDGTTLKIGDTTWEKEKQNNNIVLYKLPAGSYYLGGNIELNAIIVTEGSVNLCLNGHTITETKGETITVGKDENRRAEFTLTDCQKGNAQGKITRAAANPGRGVFVFKNSKFNMYGGSIVDHTYKEDNNGGAGVGAMGTFNMYGGNISNNSAIGTDMYGGGVFAGGTFNMYGGSITGNTSSSGGGGVIVNISGNGTEGKFTVSGKVTIEGNKSNGKDDNVYLEKSTDGKKLASITIGGTLTASEKIGVTTAIKPTEDNSIVIATKASNEDKNKFVSDDSNYVVAYEADGKLVLKANVSNKTAAGVSLEGEAPSNKTYGDKDFALKANAANSGANGNWTWSSTDPSVLEVTGSGDTATIKVRKSGQAKITAKYESDTTVGQYETTITVAKRTITIKANDKSMTVNGKLPNFDVSYEGFVNGETAETVFATQPTANIASEVDGKTIGTFAITVTAPTFKDDMGDKYEIGTTTNGTLTVKAASSGGSYTPTNPTVTTVTDKTRVSAGGSETTTKTTVSNSKTETTKDAQGQEVSKTTATVSKTVADELVKQAVANKADTVEITVKTNGTAAADAVKSTELAIPKNTVEEIAKSTDADLLIKAENSQVVLDNKTLETIAKETKGDTVKIILSEDAKLTEAQKSAAEAVGEAGKIFDLKAQNGDTLLHSFGGGKAHVTLPMPTKLNGKDLVVIYINDRGFCEILNHTMETIGADKYIKFTTTNFSTFAVVERESAEKLVKEQNLAQVKQLMKDAKFKVTTSKTSKKSVKVTVTSKKDTTLISDIRAMGFTVKYQFYRSTKKASGYKAMKTKTVSTYTNTTGTKGTKYYYKARVLVYDGNTLVAKSALKQASYGTRTWTK